MIRDPGFVLIRAAVLTWAACVPLAGCGPSEKLPECAPVTGKVTIGGEPLANAMITFHPAGGENKGQASSDPDGTYVLNTYRTDDGAVVGPHVVTVERYIMPMPTQPGGRIPGSKAGVPKKYTRPESSPLKVEVNPGTNNVIDLALEK